MDGKNVNRHPYLVGTPAKFFAFLWALLFHFYHLPNFNICLLYRHPFPALKIPNLAMHIIKGMGLGIKFVGESPGNKLNTDVGHRKTNLEDQHFRTKLSLIFKSKERY